MARTFDQYMAETGRQSELDRLRATGQYDAAKAAYESGAGSGTFQQSADDYISALNQYTDQLKQTAQNNADFITKFLDKQHKIALGQNDQALAKFYEDVSDSLEKDIGRIPFDFQQKTQREKEDIQFELDQIASQRGRIQEQTDFEKEIETQARREEFNRRGLLGSGIEAKRAEQQERARQLRLAAQLDPLSEREQRAQVLSGRNIQDITTEARRAAENQQFEEQKQREQTQLNLENRLAELNRERDRQEVAIRQQLAGAFASGLEV